MFAQPSPSSNRWAGADGNSYLRPRVLRLELYTEMITLRELLHYRAST